MDDLISRINKPADLRNFNEEELKLLAIEIRKEIIRVVSTNGGHLASNLGVVELTIALLRQYNLPEDQIVWDVGHQTYTYKMLTGRYGDFCTLRMCNGLAGFPKRCESEYDCFNTGHSSTSISAALGILRANNIKGDHSKVIAVIGDGALTGGMAFEALNDAGQSDMDLLVILNDNEMSIGRNVGGMAKHLSAIRVSKRYLNLKHRTDKILSKTSLGRFLKKILEIFKHLIRYIIRPEKVIFEDLGFKYYGPVDGHDINDLELHFAASKNIRGPVLIHVLTKKGKGYEFAENSPDKYHGVAPFEIANGIPLPQRNEGDEFSSFSEAFAEILCDLASEDDSIAAISAAMTSGTGLDKFEKRFPKRFFDVGIAEQHALTMAAGMACGNVKPVIAIYSTFLQRAYDQLLHDIALQDLHVVLCIDRAGIVGEDGETHQGIYDIALLRSIPGMTILSPRNYEQLRSMISYALYTKGGPVAIRYPRGGEPKNFRRLTNERQEKIIFDETAELLHEGNDLTIITEGIMFSYAYEALIKLQENGIKCDLLDVRIIKPLPAKQIIISAIKTKCIMTIENGINNGGLGSAVEELLSDNQILVPVIRLGVGDHPLVHGKISELFRIEGIDAAAIYNEAVNAVSIINSSYKTINSSE